ncbi:regulator of protease activity HflC (stomatin/prohibitin superfamily) [Kibdelosporangium banguiense]|uniref:Regulator of protease activity HflC (Stomatin/prohibitin superfamily) n=1 Tax=Kibdelosporangium banguiense TaxID=1365924 RepID=A0ABS4T7W7_9PSEU|nr:SPFH domain-containing protein [Kibdelosporangium banguiense]MBP2320532.1 regulator of protease activity HflC (stomatin/prohibitin superfamily) [Kibdelosporangium banguiense]
MTTDASVDMPVPRVREQGAVERAGLPIAIGAVAGELLSAGLLVWGVMQAVEGSRAAGVAMIIVAALLIAGFTVISVGITVIAPGEARVLQFFGRYVGTVRTSGLRWVNPFTTRAKVSTRIRNHETSVMKVNELDGNPIEIAAVVVWQVQDTARAMFEVDNFVQFVGIQTETAIRHIANSYPYDSHGTDALSLRDNADEITEKLSAEIAARVESAGVRVIESRLTHLAYAPEIAQAMLRRQQAGAVVAARQLVVEGAVGMVELALERLAERDVVDLDEERKAAMVSNLLVVLCGDRDTQPVVNTGSLYQ